MRDHYEVLGVEESATAGEIKKAYYKLSLKFHPDRNFGNDATECEKKFKEIQSAHATLSDPQERAYYDRHKDEIVRGQAFDDDTHVNLYYYFSSACYDGMEGQRGFYTVYHNVFQDLIAEEEMDTGASVDWPVFGTADSTDSVVDAFYKHWMNFSTKKCFVYADKYDERDVTGRYLKRVVQKENEKQRREEKRAFNDRVRHLVQIVQKRDPRWLGVVQRKQEAASARKAAEKERQDQLLNAKKAKRAEARARRDAEVARLEEIEAAREADPTVVSPLDDWDFDTPAVAGAGPRVDVDIDDDLMVWLDVTDDGLRCAVCDKVFRTDVLYVKHCGSKKHRVAVEKAEEMEKARVETDEAAKEDKQEEEVPPTPTPTADPPRRGKGRRGRGDSDNFNFGIDSEDESAQQRTEKKERKAKKKAGKKKAGAKGEKSSAACEVCGMVFDTRNRLFGHIKETGHAAFK